MGKNSSTTHSPSKRKMKAFQEKFVEIATILEKGEYEKLSEISLDVPDTFNWVRDVFEPLVVEAHGSRTMLEIVTDHALETKWVTYKQGLEKCNQLLRYLRSQGVQQGDSVFIMCGLHEGLWISYLSAIKGGLILIPAASILRADDIVYRFQKAKPKVIITDLDNAGKMEEALQKYEIPVSVKLILDGERDGWIIPMF